MPIDYKKYPKDWKQIRARILKRANNCCELCHAPNGQVVLREKATGRWQVMYFYYSKEIYKKVKIILTVAHLDHNLKHNEDYDLLALCQRCHLKIDLPKKIRSTCFIMGGL
jgi:hypothetical protein